MTAFSILLHHIKDPNDIANDNNWMISRKYDGMAFIWDGITRGMPLHSIPWAKWSHGQSTGLWALGRLGEATTIYASEKFLDSLPKNVSIQGELWIEGDRVQEVTSICRTKIPNEGQWDLIHPIVFQIKPYCLYPEIEKLCPSIVENKYYKNCGYFHRFKEIISLGLNVPEHSFLNQGYYENLKLVTRYLELRNQEKWEGLVFQKLDAHYELGRSYTCLKYKPTYETEGLVIGYVPGKTGRKIGSYAGLKVQVKWDTKIISIHGSNSNMIGKTVFGTVTGLSDYECQHIVDLFPLYSEVKFNFLSVSKDGVPQSANMWRDHA